VVLNVKITRHGPVVNDLIDGLKNDKPVAFIGARKTHKDTDNFLVTVVLLTG
jgi:hypothetical protein